MLTYHPSYDGGTFEEGTPKLTTDCLLRMMQNAWWAERMYIELDMFDQARRYSQIWHRLFKVTTDRMLKRK